MGVRDRVLDASEELFAKNGYENTSIMDIIETAEVSKGGLYHHFASKEEILDSLLKEFAKLLKLKFEESNQNAKSLKQVFQNYANAKSLLSSEKQELYSQFIFGVNDIVIREKFLSSIRQQLLDPIMNSIKNFTDHTDPKVAAFILLSLPETIARLPADLQSDHEFMIKYGNQIQMIIEGMF